MNEKNEVNIIDISGNTLSSHKNSQKIKGFLKKNLWNVLGTGIAFVVTFISSVRLLVANGYAGSCSSYYGVPKRYFDGTEIFYDKFLFLASFIFLIIYPFFMMYINRKLKSKFVVFCMFFATICILFIQNISFSVHIIDSIQWGWLKGLIDNYIVIAIFFACDIILAFYMLLRKSFWREKPLGRWEIAVLFCAVLIYLMNICPGFSLTMNADISARKNYEIMSNNKVIISEYDGKFLTMKCRINDGELAIEKGVYYFDEMTDEAIVYEEFERVLCE